VKSADLVDAVVEGRDQPGLRLFEPLGPGDRTERPITVDQTNSSVVVGERVVVKWMRSPGADRSPRLLAHLAAAGFTRMPVPHAALFSGGDLVALVTQFLPGALDGWDWGVDALLAALDGGPPADFGADLGALAAELHAALATPTAIIPEPVSVGPGAEDWKTAVDEAVAVAGDDADGGWLRSIAPRLAADVARQPAPGPALVLHGDLHVGQVLRWRDGYAVTDFDGHPTAEDRPEPVARDIAQLRTSVLHVAEIANRRTGNRFRPVLLKWGRKTAGDLLTAYRAGLADRGLSDLLDLDLLRPYEVEQECRELVYAARFLPRWRYAPMGVLKSWYQ
jgi:maltokinase